MTPEQILACPARVLSQAQREHYFEHGYVAVEQLVPEATLSELQAVTQAFVERSREVTASDMRFDIGPGHCAKAPVLRRLKSPDTAHPTYWGFSTGLMADVAADLVGPNVVFHHSKLNFKWFDEIGHGEAGTRTSSSFPTPTTTSSPSAVTWRTRDMERRPTGRASRDRSHEARAVRSV